MNILIVSSSANGDASVSNGLVGRFVDSVRAHNPAARVVLRDVGASPLPHLTSETVAAIKGEPKTAIELETRALSDSLVEELQQADLIVIASPMYNFGISSTLKAWFDHVARAGATFRYTESRSRGPAQGQEDGRDPEPCRLLQRRSRHRHGRTGAVSAGDARLHWPE